MIRIVLAFLIAAVLSHYLTPVLRQAAVRFGIVDHPDGKLKKHRAPVPYLGGIAIYLSFLLSLALTAEFEREVLGILLAGAIVVLLGLIDDLGALSPSVKLAGQVVAILTLMKASVTIKLAFLPPVVSLPLSFLWLLAVTNAFNLIDIMDGLAAGVGLVSAVILACVAAGNGRQVPALLLAALAGGLLGFLRYNVEPARIYMGDTGSLFLGLMLGALAMNNSYTTRNLVASISPVVILGVPIFDMLFVMFIRWRRGIPVMRGSPDHFALRLRKWRLTTRQTVGTSCLATAVLGGVGIAMMLVQTREALLLLGLTVLLALALGFYLKKIEMIL
jgi:UDP-GlcNAc:undecaprenyl-phosphate/decaprenyl-phosphate GlcNAc-1-phosphate transferase